MQRYICVCSDFGPNIYINEAKAKGATAQQISDELKNENHLFIKTLNCMSSLENDEIILNKYPELLLDEKPGIFIMPKFYLFQSNILLYDNIDV